jgi:hypothetical protein
MITHRLPLERALEGFGLARERQALKVMIGPDTRLENETDRMGEKP